YSCIKVMLYLGSHSQHGFRQQHDFILHKDTHKVQFPFIGQNPNNVNTIDGIVKHGSVTSSPKNPVGISYCKIMLKFKIVSMELITNGARDIIPPSPVKI